MSATVKRRGKLGLASLRLGLSCVPRGPVLQALLGLQDQPGVYRISLSTGFDSCSLSLHRKAMTLLAFPQPPLAAQYKARGDGGRVLCLALGCYTTVFATRWVDPSLRQGPFALATGVLIDALIRGSGHPPDPLAGYDR